MTHGTRGTLYVVATPIGNVEDITPRARRILAEADLVAAEDTRSAGLLFKALDIKNKVVSYHKFNEKYREDFLLSELERGMDVAIVSDAGTPCISDPGGIVVKAAAEHGIRVVPVCGTSAATAALSVCGFDYDSYTFYGFLPRSSKAIAEIIAEARDSSTDVAVFYESPKRVKKTLSAFEANSPDAQICLCNDLTKTYERIYRGTTRQILDELADNPSAEKGEYTLVCLFGDKQTAPRDTGDGTQAPPQNATGGTQTPPQDAASPLSSEATLVEYLSKNGGTPKDAINHIANMKLFSKKELYAAVNRLTKLFNDF